MRRIVLAGLITLAAVTGAASAAAADHGHYTNYLLLHAIGSETWSVAPGPDGAVLTTTFTMSDRGTTRTSVTTLTTTADGQPTRLQLKRDGPAAAEIWRAEIAGASANVEEPTGRRTFAKPPTAFVGFSAMPAALQERMIRYWRVQGEPTRLAILRASAEAPALEIRREGADVVRLHGRAVRLTRLSVANLMFGRELVWTDAQGRLAALMTFAGGLPQEQVLDAYAPAFDQLVKAGVGAEMARLDALGREVRPEASGAYAIVGARLIDGTGAPAIADSAVLIRNGRIAAAGPRGQVRLPKGIKLIHAEGRSLLPGLWEMHSHYSGVEFGPALLAAGVTTARDCGGEFGFLTSIRRKLNHQGALGPRLLAAGLIDSGGILGFGAVDAETPAEGVAAVDRYANAGFEQIKVYTQLKPEVLKAIADEAHRRDLTVTGHVPAAVDAFGGIAAGMDQINHLQFVTRPMQGPDGKGPVDLASEPARRLIALMAARQTVIDPTDGWGEMAGHPGSIPAASLEPGLAGAPFAVAVRFEALGGAADATRFRDRMAENGRVIAALAQAGVPIVAGSDTGLIGYGLDRELELYVQAGLSPMAAIQTATLGAARAMKLDADSGSIEVGKRADLVLVEGDPLADISDLRRVVKVVRDGRIYDSLALGRSVGFRRSLAPAHGGAG